MTDIIEEAEREFTEYFVRNYPGPDTVIYDPKWHAPKLFRAATHKLSAALSGLIDPKEEGDPVVQLREALQRMEDCCDQLAGTRTREVYDAMINSGQTDALLDLDNARLNARKVLLALALGLTEGSNLYTPALSTTKPAQGDDPTALAARHARINRICSRILWSDYGVPSLENDQTKSAFSELFELLFAEKMGAALAAQGDDAQEEHPE